MSVSNMTPASAEGLYGGKTRSYSGHLTTKVDPFLPLMPRKGDLTSIKQFGYLRILNYGSLLNNSESELLSDFADQYDLKIITIAVNNPERASKFLKEGHADILIGDRIKTNGVLKTLPIKLPNGQTISWMVRSENTYLRNALNDHLNRHLISQGFPEIYMEDLPDLKKRKLLRVAMQPDPHNYFLKNGKPAGFEYELLQRFARQQKLWLDIVIAKSEAEMIKWLKNGKVDLATISAIDLSDPDIVSTFPYYPARNFIITRRDEKKLTKLEDIDGHLLILHSGKYQHQGIEFLMDNGFTISTEEPDSDLSIKAFLQRIVEGKYRVAMVSARDYIKAGQFHDQLKVIATVNDQPLHRWAVKKQHNVLNVASNSFLRNEFQSKFFNIVYKRYFPEKLKEKDNDNFYISPYDKLVKKYAERYQFDWRLILAQMYQESHFKADAVSDSGAKGLMQILPGTAREVGLTRVEDPETGIRAGLKYMKKLRDRYSTKLSQNEKNWFALASYNAGYERIEDARRFAKKLGLDPNRWFGHVEQAMQKLASPQYRKHTRFGFCRCGQTVAYVRNIRKLYKSYIQLSDPLIIASVNQDLFTDNASDHQYSHF